MASYSWIRFKVLIVPIMLLLNKINGKLLKNLPVFSDLLTEKEIVDFNKVLVIALDY